jgi:hypothetical protein
MAKKGREANNGFPDLIDLVTNGESFGKYEGQPIYRYHDTYWIIIKGVVEHLPKPSETKREK